MFLNLYVFSIIGIELFKGTVYPGLEVLKGMDFDVLGYHDCCTFNTIIDAMFTTFHLMVTNNWIVTAKAHIKATTPWAFIYFVVYYFMTFVILLSLLIATIVETFLFKLKQVEKLERDIIQQELAEYKPGEALQKHDNDNDEWQVSSSHLETNATMFAQTVYTNDEQLNRIRTELRKDTIVPIQTQAKLGPSPSDSPSRTMSKHKDGLNTTNALTPTNIIGDQSSHRSSISSNGSVASNLTPRQPEDVPT